MLSASRVDKVELFARFCIRRANLTTKYAEGLCITNLPTLASRDIEDVINADTTRRFIRDAARCNRGDFALKRLPNANGAQT